MEPSVQVLKSVRARGELWFEIEVMSHSECEGISDPTVNDVG